MTTLTATTTAPTGITLDLRGSGHGTYGVAVYPTKKAALAALAALRDCGRNRDRTIEIHQADVRFFWLWVISRPDNYHGITYLMTADGRWVAGRLTDMAPCWCVKQCPPTGGTKHTAPWTRLASIPAQPATVTHDYRYSAGSTGVLGGDGKPLMSMGVAGRAPVEVLAWSTQAWCVACTWSWNGDHEESTRLAARWHRNHPEQHPGHLTPRRLPSI